MEHKGQVLKVILEFRDFSCFPPVSTSVTLMTLHYYPQQ